jgi:predicted short-subunit dehydrogenase-like oxidoreductase (DUF2520 family)
MGQGIAIALVAAGIDVRLLARRPRPLAAPLALYSGPWEEATRAAELVLVVTPDDTIPDAARSLLERGAVRSNHAVLHLSGLLDRSALAPLERTGAALGSFHPLQTVADPQAAPGRLRGAWAGLEGDPGALEAGERLAGWLGMRTVHLSAGAKPLYHAAAVLAANYTVALAAVAERLARMAGVPEELAGRIYLPLLAGAVENLRASPAAAALTGPVTRGDVDTVRRHLAALPADVQPLYCALGLETLALARDSGLDPAIAERLEHLLQRPPP